MTQARHMDNQDSFLVVHSSMPKLTLITLSTQQYHWSFQVKQILESNSKSTLEPTLAKT